MNKHYAMTVCNRVIDVLFNQESEPNWPPIPGGTPVIAIECDDTIEHGMLYDPETNIFTKEESVVEDILPTQLDRIESIVSEDREAAINEAIDVYTLELMNEGII